MLPGNNGCSRNRLANFRQCGGSRYDGLCCKFRGAGGAAEVLLESSRSMCCMRGRSRPRRSRFCTVLLLLARFPLRRVPHTRMFLELFLILSSVQTHVFTCVFTKCLPIRYLVLTTACPVRRNPLTVISSLRFPISRVPPAIAFPFLFV